MESPLRSPLFPVGLILAALAGCGEGPEPPRPGAGPVQGARAGLDAEGRMRIGPEDRCAACAMSIADHALDAAAAVLRDGRTYYFCGSGCLIRSWLHPEKKLGAARKDLARAVVRDYFDGTFRDAGEVVFVAGSDVTGPMGPAFVPVRPEDLSTFTLRHGGSGVFRLAELDDARWEAFSSGGGPRPPSRP